MKSSIVPSALVGLAVLAMASAQAQYEFPIHKNPGHSLGGSVRLHEPEGNKFGYGAGVDYKQNPNGNGFMGSASYDRLPSGANSYGAQAGYHLSKPNKKTQWEFYGGGQKVGPGPIMPHAGVKINF